MGAANDHPDIIPALRQRLNLTPEQVSDEDLLKGTEGSLSRDISNLRLNLHDVKVSMEDALKDHPLLMRVWKKFNPDPNEWYPTIACPKCGDETGDMDGFGFIACTECGACIHPSRDGTVCGICGHDEAAQYCECALVYRRSDDGACYDCRLKPLPMLHRGKS